MNILFLTKEVPYPPTNGHRVRSWNLLKGLAKKHRVTLVCFGNGVLPEGTNKVLNEHCCDVQFVPQIERGSGWERYLTACLSLFSVLPFSIKVRYSAAMKSEVAELCRLKKTDLVFCDGVHQAAHIPFGRCRVVLSEHNIESVIMRRYWEVEKNVFKKFFGWLEHQKTRRFETRVWTAVEKSYVCSEIDRDLIRERVPSAQVDVIPNGVDTDYYSAQTVDLVPLSLIYIGLMNWKPNEDAVLYFLREIFPLVKKQVPGARFWVVGNKPSKAIQGRAQRDPSVIVTGFVDDVRPYVSQSQVFVVPLRIGSGTRLKILEALSMEKAVISTSIGCEGINVHDGKNILIADTPGLFAEKICKLFEDGSLRERLGQEGGRLVKERYSWDRIVVDMNAAIESLRNGNAKETGIGHDAI